VIARKPKCYKLAVYNKSVDQIITFKHLGDDITSINRNLKEEEQAQTTKVVTTSDYLRHITWKNKYMNLKSKIKIYRICVRPVMTYVIETRAGTINHHQTSTEMRILRCITTR